MFESTGARISLYLLLTWYAIGFMGLFPNPHSMTQIALGCAVLGFMSSAALAGVVEAENKWVKLVLEPVVLVEVVASANGYYQRGGGLGWGGIALGAVLIAVFAGMVADVKDKRRDEAALEAMRKRDAAKALNEGSTEPDQSEPFVADGLVKG